MNDQVYAFVESPENEKILAGIEPGTGLLLTGKLFVPGALLELESATPALVEANVFAQKLAETEGVEVTVEGVNKCQCGLDLGGLRRSCGLGHLHHLVDADGKTYNYLQFGDGQAMFAGGAVHFKALEVKAREFPGHFLLVESMTIK